jgi:phospholipid N-methyltransferase
MGKADIGGDEFAPCRGNSGPLGQMVLFARNFFKHPKLVGWLLPSSRFLVDEVLKQVDWANTGVVVEYGAGTGTFTKEILNRLRPDGHLVALEINPEFYAFLSRSIQDPRLHLVRESAAEIDAILERLGFTQVDYVISGIPFKTLPRGVRHAIVTKTHSVLRPRGGFLVYQLSGAVLPHLEQVFGNVSRDFALLNIIPARLFYCARS